MTRRSTGRRSGAPAQRAQQAVDQAVDQAAEPVAEQVAEQVAEPVVEQEPAEPATGGTVTVSVDGELTIHSAGDRKTELLQALERADRLALDLSAVGEMDTAGLQLLLLLRREAAHLGKAVEVTAVSHVVSDALAIVHLDPSLNRITDLAGAQS